MFKKFSAEQNVKSLNVLFRNEERLSKKKMLRIN